MRMSFLHCGVFWYRSNLGCYFWTIVPVAARNLVHLQQLCIAVFGAFGQNIWPRKIFKNSFCFCCLIFSARQMLSTRSVRNGLGKLSGSVACNVVQWSCSCPLHRKTLQRGRCIYLRLHKSSHGLRFQNWILEIFRWKHLNITFFLFFSFFNLSRNILFTNALNARIYSLVWIILSSLKQNKNTTHRRAFWIEKPLSKRGKRKLLKLKRVVATLGS